MDDHSETSWNNIEGVMGGMVVASSRWATGGPGKWVASRDMCDMVDWSG